MKSKSLISAKIWRSFVVVVTSLSLLIGWVAGHDKAIADERSCAPHVFHVDGNGTLATKAKTDIAITFKQSASNCQISNDTRNQFLPKIGKNTLGPFDICDRAGRCVGVLRDAKKNASSSYTVTWTKAEMNQLIWGIFYLKYWTVSYNPDSAATYEGIVLPYDGLNLTYYPLQDPTGQVADDVGYHDTESRFYKTDQLPTSCSTDDIFLAQVQVDKYWASDVPNLKFSIIDAKNKTIYVEKIDVDMFAGADPYYSNVWSHDFWLPADILKKMTPGKYHFRSTLTRRTETFQHPAEYMHSQIQNELTGSQVIFIPTVNYDFQVVKVACPKPVTPPKQKISVRMVLSTPLNVLYVASRKTHVVTFIGGKKLSHASCQIDFAGTLNYDSTALDSSGNGSYDFADTDLAQYFSQGHSSSKFTADCTNSGYEGYTSVTFLLTR
jgi:hypothetical protein